MGYLRAAPLLAAYGVIVSLAACGFTPVYAPGTQIDQRFSEIEVAPPNNRFEYLLVRNLEERIGRNPSGDTLLNHTLIIFEEGLEVVGAARSQIVGEVRYQLVSKDTGQVIATGSVKSFTAYSPSSQVLVATQRDTAERLMQILADKTISDLTIKLLRGG
ncbi:LPS assembly lipoprotein LptE [Roseovarius nanhaiticus]|uniref:LPS assembly lipoprotein LptE n=1 Tax=Roseovarius nanhaiticus TaxID=573024 RepID=UPI00249025A0|nr:LPS assembly lipoprotein LptE [Roseovarius nanhaiticus]